jgi:hypothetical protein
MSSTPHSSIAATAHFVESERILAALPLATKRGERDHQMQLALVNSVLAIAASLLGEWQNHEEPPDQDQP